MVIIKSYSMTGNKSEWASWFSEQSVHIDIERLGMKCEQR